MNEQKEAARARAREIAEGFLEKGDLYGWFEEFYKDAAGDAARIPWANREPDKFLIKWNEDEKLIGKGRSALVVGCGLGDDAKYLADREFQVTAFDVSQEAIEWAKRLHKGSRIAFNIADLFDAPAEWYRAFDLVLEAYTVQALPLEVRQKAIEAIAGFVRPGGELIVIERLRNEKETPDGLPWPLSNSELKQFVEAGLKSESISMFRDDGDEVTKFVALFRRHD